MQLAPRPLLLTAAPWCRLRALSRDSMASGAAEAVSTGGQNRRGSKPRQGGARVAVPVLAASGGRLGATAATPSAASTPQLALPPADGSPASASAPADRTVSDASNITTMRARMRGCMRAAGRVGRKRHRQR